MPIMSQPGFGTKLSIGFITGGALVTVWTLVWRYTESHGTLSDHQQFFFLGTLLSGITILLIGMFLGSIGRAARKAELPPDHEAFRAEAKVQANAAANPNPGIAATTMAPGVLPTGTGSIPLSGTQSAPGGPR